jgi:hypothetical protein
MRKTVVTVVVLVTLASPVKATAQAWADGMSWGQAFPEHEMFGAFAPRYAAEMVSANVRSPEWLIQDWNRLPNDLHQQDCGIDGLGKPKRCMDEIRHGALRYYRRHVALCRVQLSLKGYAKSPTEKGPRRWPNLRRT